MKAYLTSTHPDLVEEWSDSNLLRPENVTAGSGKTVTWVCSQRKHEYEAIVKNRTKGSGCPYCSGKKVLAGYNDVATTHPHLIAEWADENQVKTTEVSAGSQKKISWTCVSSHNYVASVYSRAVLDSGCPYCAGQKVIKGTNDLRTTHPELVSQWHHENTLSPEEVSAGSNKTVQWVCSADESHVWAAVIASRAQKKRSSGCPYCSGRKAVSGGNDVATTHPHLIAEWADENREMSTVSAGSDYKATWKCPKGHYWECTVYKRAKLERECDVCNNRKLLRGYNDFVTTHPELSKEWSPDNELRPDEVIAGSSLRVQWVCRKNAEHRWWTSVSNRTLAYLSTGCPHCYARTFVSKGESKIHEYIKELLVESSYPNVVVQQSARGIIPGRELDIYIPDLNFAIEYNGLYWHSETNGKDKWYHYNKYKDCKDRGIKLFQIWEDDYNTNTKLVKKMIAHQLNMNASEVIYARNTTFSGVGREAARDFLSQNHLQGMNYASAYYGLKARADDDLIALIGLQRKGNALEISRFATSGRVTGAFSKLLTNTLKEDAYADVEKLISYSHNDHSWGGVYQKNGFEKVHDGAPGYFYFTQGQLNREFRRSYTIQSFEDRSDLLFEEGLTETELAALNGLHRIWDSGSSRWEKQL